MSGLLTFAVNHKLLDDNPCKYAKPYKDPNEVKKEENAVENFWEVDEFNNFITTVENIDHKALKDIVDKIALDYQSSILFFADVIDNSRINFIAKAVGNNVNCGQLVKVAAVATGGNGGGRNDFAQAGGKEVNKLVEALKLVEEKIKCDI